MEMSIEVQGKHKTLLSS